MVVYYMDRVPCVTGLRRMLVGVTPPDLIPGARARHFQRQQQQPVLATLMIPMLKKAGRSSSSPSSEWGKTDSVLAALIG